MEESSNTEQSQDNKPKPTIGEKHGYSIITAIIIALLTCGYLFYILPNNKAKEDRNNIAVLQGIEQQLKSYIDDQVKYIDDDKMKSLGLLCYKGSLSTYIDTIIVKKEKIGEVENGTIKLSRKIVLSGRPKNSSKYPKENCASLDTIDDPVSIDLAKFLTKVNSTTHFTSFFICPIENGTCQAYKSFISENVSLADQDSLIDNSRKNGPFDFKGSTKHYYANQVKIPNTNYAIFLATGIDNTTFQINIREIDNNLLIISLLLVIVLVLGINFIKPIVSSYKERLSQKDLISVAFSIGILIAVLVVFSIISYWDNSIKNRTTNDLKTLVERIDKNFKDQIKSYQNWPTDSRFKDKREASENNFTKIYLETGSKISSVNGDSLTKDDISLRKEEKYIDIKSSALQKATKDSIKLAHLDNYFRMNNYGLITTDLSTSIPNIRRKYADRMYFEILQRKNENNQNERKINKLLTAVFSRENNRYQWIYAERNPISEEKGIKGIAFREYFSEEIILPPGTGYMIIDRGGEVLMQNDPEKNLYQNLRYGSKRNLELISLLSGVDQKSFELEYQGTFYQVYAKKLDIKIDSPVYILGIRNLSHLDRLAIFTFSNGFLISLFYGFFILLITYIYSALFYTGRLSLLSNQHFYHLFPDNSRTYQYKQLLIVNSIAILFVVIVSLISSPSIALTTCIITGFNLVLINLITLNIRTLKPEKDLIILVLILLVITILLLGIIFFLNSFPLAIFILFSAHAVLIFHYRNWRKKNTENLEQFKKKNKGVNRKAYTRFMTVRLIYHFAIFPFVLICAFYINELNDFASYYCSSDQIKEKITAQTKKQSQEQSQDYTVNAYSCDCTETKEKPLIVSNSKDYLIEKANIGFLDRPAMYEIKNFTFYPFKDLYYLSSTSFLKNENIHQSFVIILTLFIGLFFLTILVYHLLNYYSNHFFFYDLMQAAYEKYYPCTKHELANDHIFIAMVNNDDIKKLIQVPPGPIKTSADIYQDMTGCTYRDISIDKVFDKDNRRNKEDIKDEKDEKHNGNNEISPFLRMNFILNYNHNKFSAEYNKIWKSLPEDGQTRSVLYDFAQDQFVNYKNKGIIMDLMEKGIIDCHPLTGRLKMMNLSFRIFILSKSKQDKFITKFKDESKNGTYSKLKIPIFIVAISALLLLMYLNKDSYDRVAVMGGSIVSVIALLNKFLEANKSL